MRQLRLLPSGCQSWNNNVIDAGGDKFIYSSTLACYVHSMENYKLDKLISTHERTITGLSFNKVNPRYFATSSLDMRVCVWDSQEEKQVAAVPTGDAPVMVDWCPVSDKLCAVLLRPGSVFLYNYLDKPKVLSPVKGMGCGDINCIRWRHKGDGSPVLAAGLLDGAVWLWEMDSNSVVKIPSPDKKRGTPVIDLQWDPLSNNFILVTYAKGYMSLIDADAHRIVLEFDKQSQGMSMAAFIKHVPGGFLTANSKAGQLALWNVSKSKPVELIKLGRKVGGLNSIKATEDGNRFLVAFKDSSVGVFDFDQRRLLSCTTPAHAETIFDCRFKPSSPDILATASYDSTIKIWDTKTMTCLSDNVGHNGVIFAISWAPGDEDEVRLLSSSSSGEIILWDTKQAVKTAIYKHHKKAIYRVAWNQNDIKLAASTSSDGYCVVFNPETGKQLKRYKHPAACYGCDWSPFDKNLLATGCHDKIVRVFDTDLSSTKPIHELKGHTARVFNTVWSPLLKGYLASGSDDRTIKVWKVGTDKVFTLKGHTHNVRALVWHYEIPYILLSGSWDGTVRIWDIRHEITVATVYDHFADVYGLASHPLRPFVFASSSRDTSLRVWTVDDTLVAQFKAKYVLNGGKLLHNTLAETKEVMGNTAPLRLTGFRSLEIANATKNMEELEAYTMLFRYLSSVPGVEELWDLADVLNNEKATRKGSKVSHVNDLRHIALAKAIQFEQKQTVIVGKGTTRDRLEQAADIYLKLGKVRKYCDIQIGLGNWERAIAVAPSVGVGFWKKTALQYADLLAAKGDDRCIAFYMSTGEHKKLVAYQNRMREFEDSLLTVVSDATDHIPQVDGDDEEPGQQEGEAEEKSRDDVPVTDAVKAIINTIAEEQYRDGHAVRAACVLLSVGAAQEAVEKLMLGNEICLALALARVLKLEYIDHVWVRFSQVCEQLGLWEDAFEALQNIRDPMNATILLAGRFVGGPQKRADYYQACELRTPESFAESGQQSWEDGKLAEGLRYWVAGQKFEVAVEKGLGAIEEILTKPSWSVEEVNELLEPLRSVNAVTLPEPLRYKLLAHSAFIGAQTALYKGYTPVLSCLFRTVRELEKKGGFEFPVHESFGRLQEINYTAASDPDAALKMVNELIAEPTCNPKVKAGAAATKKRIEEVYLPNPQPPVTSGILVPTSSILPSGSRKRFPATSLVSGTPIANARFVLEDTKSCISLAEALMWADCTPFSPLNTGVRLNLS